MIDENKAKETMSGRCDDKTAPGMDEMKKFMSGFCGEDGKPDFERMGKFMADCGCGCFPMQKGQNSG